MNWKSWVLKINICNCKRNKYNDTLIKFSKWTNKYIKNNKLLRTNNKNLFKKLKLFRKNNNKLTIKIIKYQNYNAVSKLFKIKIHSPINPSKIIDSSIIKFINISNLSIPNTVPMPFCTVPVKFMHIMIKIKIDSNQHWKKLLLFRIGWKMLHPKYKNSKYLK